MLIVHLDGVQPLDKTWGSKLLLKHETCYQYKCSVTKDLLCTVISMKYPHSVVFPITRVEITTKVSNPGLQLR